MRRLAAAPIFVQVLALVAMTAVAAQVAMLAALLAMEEARRSFTFDDVAEAIRAAPAGRAGETLSVAIANSPPEGWERDDLYERRVAATVAESLGIPPEHVLAERQLNIPGGAWAVRRLYPEVAGTQTSVIPFEPGRRPDFQEIAVAARLSDGRWAVVSPPSPWLGHVGIFALVWLLASALLLVPLAWVFTRRLVAPIRAFAETAERAGRGDRDAAFPATGAKEIRTAGRALAEMQRRVAEAVDERTRLIAAVAHDLRTPLARLRFRAEYAPPEHRNRIVSDIERMVAMIGGVLAFTRGEERLNRQRLDLTTLVQSVADDFVEMGAEVAIAEAAPVEVVGDPLALRRLVANLFDNAVKYGGGARCRIFREDGDALLLVEDHGSGMAEEVLERMFIPFERGGAARDPATGGVGLGLALARGIARAHGGDVWLSRRSTHGLCAHVRLPADVGRSQWS